MVNSPGFGCAFVSLIPLTHFNLNFQVLQRESNRLSNLPESPTNWVWVWRREWKVWETGRLVRSLMLAHFTLFRSPPLVHLVIICTTTDRERESWVTVLCCQSNYLSPLALISFGSHGSLPLTHSLYFRLVRLFSFFWANRANVKWMVRDVNEGSEVNEWNGACVSHLCSFLTSVSFRSRSFLFTHVVLLIREHQRERWEWMVKSEPQANGGRTHGGFGRGNHL